MFSVLVVAYKRPHLLKKIIEEIPSKVSKIYISVDLSPNSDYINTEVIRISQDLCDSDSRISLRISERNLGPGLAIPIALDWALQTSDVVLVLEDDCIPNIHAYNYFEANIENLRRRLVICGTSPYDFQGSHIPQTENSISSYALVSGWMIDKKTWDLLDFNRHLNIRMRDVLRASLRKPKSSLALSFFYASIIRVRKGRAEAWDSTLCLSMIMQNVHAIIPNRTVIDNLGFDSVASNTRALSDKGTNIYNKSNETEPSNILNSSREETEKTNRLIEELIYNMRFRNYLSPFKSLLIANRDRR